MEWSYHCDGGMRQWNKISPNCDGLNQSPINILTSAVVSKRFDPLHLKELDQPIGRVTVVNNGHTVVFKLDAKKKWALSGAGLEGVYRPISFHFHWGSPRTNGSEHTIDGERATMELHIVTINMKYKTVEKAVKQSNGLAVFGVMVQVAENERGPFEDLTRYVRMVQDKVSAKEVVDIGMHFTELIPNNLTKFYRYKGSLTTPNCNEAVTWTIFNEPLYISSGQMSVFYGVQGRHGVILDNFRTTQPRNNRTVYYSGGKMSPESLNAVVTVIMFIPHICRILSALG